jgi:hypothetical protein
MCHAALPLLNVLPFKLGFVQWCQGETLIPVDGRALATVGNAITVNCAIMYG